MLKGRKVVVGVTGGIAAYKACDLCSQLRKAGAEVRVAMTAAATAFVSPLTFEALTQSPVYSSVLHRETTWEMEHISWAKWADLFIIAPASANTIAKLASGLADDPLSTLYLSFEGVTVVAPAMNTVMLQHAATQANLALLRERGVHVIESAEGLLACGDHGAGKLAPVDRIVNYLTTTSELWQTDRPVRGSLESESTSTPPHSSATQPQTPTLPTDDSLSGKTVLITSGPTHEFFDPVRFLSNPSSGKMGAALTLEALRRGAKTHLVSGPVHLNQLPQGAEVHRVTTAEQMLSAVKALADSIDIFIFCAAVSDFRVANPPTHKMKRTGNSISLTLIENPDIAHSIGCQKKPGQITVGFAAETDDMEQHALGKLERKRLDAIVANDVANPRIGFESDSNEVTIYVRDGRKIFVPHAAKSEIAHRIFEAIAGL